MSTLKPISPAQAARKIARGKMVLVDVREPHEYAREHIDGAVLVPLSALKTSGLDVEPSKPVVFHCKSGMRTNMHCDTLASHVDGEAYVLTGGLMGWKQAGLPVEKGKGGGLNPRIIFFLAGAILAGLGLVTLLSGTGG